MCFGYTDDVETLGDKLADIIQTDLICRSLEAASGAFLNRNRKTIIIGLGSWVGRRDWPLDWLHNADSVKVLGFTITPLFAASVEATWDRVLLGIEATLCFWRGRRLETLLQRVQILETYALSKAWYFAHAMPLPFSTSQHPPAIAQAARLRHLIADFLWEGCFRSLAFDECHIKPEAGGLSISCPQTRAQSLRANQTCRQLAAGGRPALHLAHWLGISLHDFLPIVASAGLTLEGPPPPQYDSLL